MDDSERKKPSLAAFALQTAKLLRSKTPKMKKRVSKNSTCSSSAKIERIAKFLRNQLPPKK